jgi:hypothetical protein
MYEIVRVAWIGCGESHYAQNQSRDRRRSAEIIAKFARWGEKEWLSGAQAHEIRCVRLRTACTPLPRQCERTVNAAGRQSRRWGAVLFGVSRIRTAEDAINVADLCVGSRHVRAVGEGRHEKFVHREK